MPEESHLLVPLPVVAQVQVAHTGTSAARVVAAEINQPQLSGKPGQAPRFAHGFLTFNHYRLRILLAASGNRPWRTNHA